MKTHFNRMISGCQVRLKSNNAETSWTLIIHSPSTFGAPMDSYSQHDTEFDSVQHLGRFFPPEDVKQALGDLYDDKHLPDGDVLVWESDVILNWLTAAKGAEDYMDVTRLADAIDDLKTRRKLELMTPAIKLGELRRKLARLKACGVPNLRVAAAMKWSKYKLSRFLTGDGYDHEVCDTLTEIADRLLADVPEHDLVGTDG